jgi:Ras-related protein Rab-5C
MNDHSESQEFKTVLLGDSGVGKTALVQQVSTGTFQDRINPTIGASVTTISIATSEGTAKFQLWDTAGQEKFRDLVPLYFRNAVCALVVFDITQRSSFENLGDWVDKLRATAPETIFGVIGNKADLSDYREVPSEHGEQFAEKEKAVFYAETSAMTGQGVDGLFPSLYRHFGKSENLETAVTVELTNEPRQSRLSHVCC